MILTTYICIQDISLLGLDGLDGTGLTTYICIQDISTACLTCSSVTPLTTYICIQDISKNVKQKMSIQLSQPTYAYKIYLCKIWGSV